MQGLEYYEVKKITPAISRLRCVGHVLATYFICMQCGYAASKLLPVRFRSHTFVGDLVKQSQHTFRWHDRVFYTMVTSSISFFFFFFFFFFKKEI